MTAPSADQGQQQGQQPGDQGKNQPKPPAAAKIKKLDVVEYTHRDPILGRAHQAVGVVAADVVDGGPVQIRPLERHTVQVEAADVAGVISADDV